MYPNHSRNLIESLETRVHLSTTPNDPSYPSQWGLSAIGASAAWDTTRGSSSVVVAAIDTGIDYTHPDLYQNIWINQKEIPTSIKSKLVDTDSDKLITFYDLNHSKNKSKLTDVNRNGRIDAADILAPLAKGGWSDGINGLTYVGDRYVDDIIGWDFANNDNNPLDYDGHGTHTAGTIGAAGNNGVGVTGVAWKVSLMALKIFTDSGYSASSSAITAAIRYAADAGSKVSNNSWGSSYYSTAIYNAISYARAKGHVFVAAAGNDGDNTDVYTANYPANFNLDNIISVGASTSSGELASYSNFGKSNVDVIAPGSSILSTYLNGQYTRMSGTSMSTPHVTGAIALMLARNASLTAAQIKTAIINGADQTPNLAGTSVAAGELNLANALANKFGRRYSAPVEETPQDPGNEVILVPVYYYYPPWWWYFSRSRIAYA